MISTTGTLLRRPRSLRPEEEGLADFSNFELFLGVFPDDFCFEIERSAFVIRTTLVNVWVQWIPTEKKNNLCSKMPPTANFSTQAN